MSARSRRQRPHLPTLSLAISGLLVGAAVISELQLRSVVWAAVAAVATYSAAALAAWQLVRLRSAAAKLRHVRRFLPNLANEEIAARLLAEVRLELLTYRTPMLALAVMAGGFAIGLLPAWGVRPVNGLLLVLAGLQLGSALWNMRVQQRVIRREITGFCELCRACGYRRDALARCPECGADAGDA